MNIIVERFITKHKKKKQNKTAMPQITAISNNIVVYYSSELIPGAP